MWSIGFVDVELLRMALLYAAPLLLAALGELVVERAGVVNIGIEGMMLVGALAAWEGCIYGGFFAGILAALLAGLAVGAIFAVVVLRYRADQIVSGAGLNLLALGVTGLVFRRMQGGAPDAVAGYGIAPMWLVPAALVLGVGCWLYFRFTRWGLELAAIGESPVAADSAGVPVIRRQLYAVFFGAACAAIAGAYLSTMRTQGFSENMTAGQGFLALAIVIFGRWSAPGILTAGIFFGLLRALAERLPQARGLSEMMSQILVALPYVVSLAAPALTAGRSGAPAALAQPYQRA